MLEMLILGGKSSKRPFDLTGFDLTFWALFLQKNFVHFCQLEAFTDKFFTVFE
jgi:hypothetical protein